MAHGRPGQLEAGWKPGRTLTQVDPRRGVQPGRSGDGAQGRVYAGQIPGKGDILTGLELRPRGRGLHEIGLASDDRAEVHGRHGDGTVQLQPA